ncbi:MAG: DUF3566 domain-containing protein [Acidimicrobiales bacterium]
MPRRGLPDSRGSSTTRAAAPVSQRRWVRRTMRRIDVGSVFRFSLVFYLALFVTFLVAGILLWIVASLAGAVHSLEHLISTLFGYQSFRFAGMRVLVATLIAGAIGVVLASLFSVLAAIIYNLVSDVVGGVNVVVEEEGPPRLPLV